MLFVKFSTTRQNKHPNEGREEVISRLDQLPLNSNEQNYLESLT